MAWLGLPGNPVSAMVTFELFARPLIRRLRGERTIFERTIPVRLRDDIKLAAPLQHFFRTVVEWEDDVAWARLTGPQGSGLLTSMSRANALTIISSERTIARTGETARALLLGGQPLASATLDV
jgi:molybdopterin molybdotransferase